ncbi:hypothetical protein [Microbacterium testaceum]|uniref:hypothetical protein n=1 Tax=Microbacterium testaceum TaxID=2033 RepID=UPI002AC48B90|nr:hypothetical protein [Microbacterium testaceum]MDZ5146378.1 hypothetical protein [Microbacterium testaceum]
MDKLIKIIESEAVREHAPKLMADSVAASVAAGVALAEGGRRLYGVAKSKMSEREAQRATADDARQQLREQAAADAPDASSPPAA